MPLALLRLLDFEAPSEGSEGSCTLVKWVFGMASELERTTALKMSSSEL
jgi:hypothetical protein